jgi:hypothetical protein
MFINNLSQIIAAMGTGLNLRPLAEMQMMKQADGF